MKRKRKDAENRLRISRKERQRVRSLRMMMTRGCRDNKARDHLLLEVQTDLSLRGHHHSRPKDLHNKEKVPREDLKSHRDLQSLVRIDNHHSKLETDQNQRKWTLMMTPLILKVEHHLPTEDPHPKERGPLEVKALLHLKAKVLLPKVHQIKDRSQGESLARLSPSKVLLLTSRVRRVLKLHV